VEVKPGSGWTLGFIIVECTVCGSKDKTKPSREGLQGTVDVTISRGPGEALTRGLQEMGEPTSVGLTILSTIIAVFSMYCCQYMGEGLALAICIQFFLPHFES